MSASATERALVDCLALQEQQISDALAPYEPLSAAYAWFDALRAIEELINLITVDWKDESFEKKLISLPIAWLQQVPNRLTTVRQQILARLIAWS